MIITTSLIFLNILLFLFNKKIIKFYGVFDQYNKNVSLIGGFYFLINILVIFNLFLFIDPPQIESFIWNKRTYLSFVISVIFIFIMGNLDDRFNLSPNTRLLLMLLIIFINLFINENLIINTIKFSNGFSFYINSNLKFFFTLLCFITIMNLVNMLDGVNLQVVIFSAFIITLSLINQSLILIINLLIALTLIFLLNYRNVIFLGNSGSYLLGYFLGFILVGSYNKQVIFTDDILLALFIPFLDMLRVIYFRLINRKHIFTGDKNHMHHILVKKFGYYKAIVIIQLLIFTPYIIYFFYKKYFLLFIILLTIIYFFIIKEKK